ncbi:MAG TPA: hypothetical protein VF108_10190 [Actinomycetota bacterium]
MKLYSLAFGLLVASIAALGLAVAGFLESTGLLFVSAGLSALAIAAAAASVLMRR